MACSSIRGMLCVCVMGGNECHAPYQDTGSGQIVFYMKGADVVMTSKVQYNDWVEEEVCIWDVCMGCLCTWYTWIVSFVAPQCGNMAREGLRTLVVGKKVLSEEQYASFEVSGVTICCHGNIMLLLSLIGRFATNRRS